MNHFMMFLLTSLSGTFMTVTANAWWIGWLGMEMNLLGFIILLMNNNSNESALKYFIMQSLSSVMLMSTAMVTENFTAMKLHSIMNLAIFLKLGAAPFHFWLPVMVEYISKYQLLFLLTWQKLAPLFLMFSLPLNNNMLLFIMCSLMVGSLSSVNEMRMFTLITYSSINHTGWMLLAMLCNEMTSLMYFIVYTVIMLTVIMPVNNKNSQMTWIIQNSNKYIIFLNLLSLGGLPPFTGFVIKWMLMTEMYFIINNMINFIIMLTSMMLLYFYLRLCTNSFFKNKLFILNTIKFKKQNVLMYSMMNMSGFYLMLICMISMLSTLSFYLSSNLIVL